MVPQPTDRDLQDRRLLAVLQALLGLRVGDLSAAMAEAAHQVAHVLGADKADVFVYAPDTREMVAEGTSDTPMGRREKELGLDRLPLANGGRAVHVFRTGEAYLARDSAHDPLELSDVVHRLGARSGLFTPLEIGGSRRGVLLASSAQPGAFSESDLAFLGAVAHWVGLTGERLAHAHLLASRAAEQGLRQQINMPKLTLRQREVAGLVREGLTNAEIGQRLVLDPGTVANHVAHILDRLGFRSRSQIAVWAAERGIGEDPESPELN